MATVTSSQPWQQKPLNQSGIRRLKIVDADALLVLRFRAELVPQRNFTLFEFIFPSDLSCVATIQRQVKESGSVFWVPTVSFSLPHISDQIVSWTTENDETLWLLIGEDYNGNTRLFGGSAEGLKMSFQATTGGRPGDANPMSFTFSAEQLLPYLLLDDYQDDVLFANDAAFSYGFSTGFNA